MIPVTERIRQSLVSLHMTRALETLGQTLSRLEKGEISAIEVIDELLAEELNLREGRRIGVALRTARLMPVKTLESFDFSFQPSLDRHRIMALAQLEFIKRAEVLHFLGPPGTGKSHLATATGVAAVRAGRSVYRCSLAELIEALTKAEREGRLAEKIRFYARASLLIVDEIGYLPITSGGANLFFQLVNARYEKGAFANGLEPVALQWLTPDLKPWLRGMGRNLRRSCRRNRSAGPPAAPRRRGSDRRGKLPAAPFEVNVDGYVSLRFAPAPPVSVLSTPWTETSLPGDQCFFEITTIPPELQVSGQWRHPD